VVKYPWQVGQPLLVQVDAPGGQKEPQGVRGVLEGLMVGPGTLLPPHPGKAEVLLARSQVTALVNPQGLCHLHSAEPTSSPGFLGCRSPETPVGVLGTTLKVPLHRRLQPDGLCAVGFGRGHRPPADSDVSPSGCVASPGFCQRGHSQLEMGLLPRTSNQDKEIPLLPQTCVSRHWVMVN